MKETELMYQFFYFKELVRKGAHLEARVRLDDSEGSMELTALLAASVNGHLGTVQVNLICTWIQRIGCAIVCCLKLRVLHMLS